MIYDRAGILARDNARTREKKQVGKITTADQEKKKEEKKTVTKAAKIKKKTPIAKRSKKLTTNERIHAKLKKDYLMDHPTCECGQDFCRGEDAVDIHHKKGRGRYLNEVETFLAVSRRCHNRIGEMGKEVYERGLSIKRNGPKQPKI